MAGKLSPSAARFEAALRALGFANEIVEHERSARTAVEAAEAVGCDVGQIVKSIVFRAVDSDRAVLVATSGPNRVDEGLVARHLGEKLAKADADFVRARTGFVIGGVPPVGHTEKPVVFIDRDLLAYDEIWAAAGTPNAVFRLTPDELVAMTGGTVISVS